MKVKEVTDLLSKLKIKTEAKQRVSKDGFIELVVLFVDMEKYPGESTLKDLPDSASEVPPFVPLNLEK